MTSLEVAVALGVTFVSVYAANRLAKHKQRSALAWMWAAALLGPFPLIPLALLPTRLSVNRHCSL
jgi:hypothetical protein